MPSAITGSSVTTRCGRVISAADRTSAAARTEGAARRPARPRYSDLKRTARIAPPRTAITRMSVSQRRTSWLRDRRRSSSARCAVGLSSGSRPDHGAVAALQRPGGRRDVGDRDQAADARRARDEDPVVARPDDRDRVAARVRVLPARRQGDVDRRPGRPRREGDQRLPAGHAAEHRLLRLPAEERGQGALAADAVSRTGDEQPQGSVRREGVVGGDDHDRHRPCLRGGGEYSEENECCEPRLQGPDSD